MKNPFDFLAQALSVASKKHFMSSRLTAISVLISSFGLMVGCKNDTQENQNVLSAALTNENAVQEENEPSKDQETDSKALEPELPIPTPTSVDINSKTKILTVTELETQGQLTPERKMTLQLNNVEVIATKEPDWTLDTQTYKIFALVPDTGNSRFISLTLLDHTDIDKRNICSESIPASYVNSHTLEEVMAYDEGESDCRQPALWPLESLERSFYDQLYRQGLVFSR